MSALQAIKYERGNLEVLDQLLLPHQTQYDKITTCEDAFACIKAMRVRGAPAIAIVAALSLAVELQNRKLADTMPVAELVRYVFGRLDYLEKSRPTAVDLGNAIKLLKRNVQTEAEVNASSKQVQETYIETAERILEDDFTTNLAIGRYGAEYIRRHQPPEEEIIEDDNSFFTTSPPGTQGAPYKSYRKLSVLTHCNTGSLATSGHGTALGIIRSLYRMNYLDHAFCTETRPYNQGSRLTAYELVYEGIPSTLITDSMAGALFSRFKRIKNIAAVVVGADRVARNGDTANKIGTYSLAVLAKCHHLKFVVAAPSTTIDLDTATGADIRIENRPSDELTQISGAVVDKEGNVDFSKSERVAIAHQGIRVWNPSFDVTPAELIDAIITEKGEVEKSEYGHFAFWVVLPQRWEADVGPIGSDGMPRDKAYKTYVNWKHRSTSGTANSDVNKTSPEGNGRIFKMEDIN